MKKFFKSKISIIILLLSFPIIFILIFKLCIKYLPGEMIGSIDGWLGFLGGYIGVLGAVGTVWWQLESEKRQKNLQYKIFLKYLLKSINNNLDINISSVLLKLYSYNSFVDEKEDLFYFTKLDNMLIQNYLSLFIEKNHTSILELKDFLDKFSYYQEKYYYEVKEKLIIYDTLSKKCPSPEEAEKDKSNKNLIIADFLNLSCFINKEVDYQVFSNVDNKFIKNKSKEDKFWFFYEETLNLLKKRSIKSKEDKEIYIKFSILYKSDLQKLKVFETYKYYLLKSKNDIETYLRIKQREK